MTRVLLRPTSAEFLQAAAGGPDLGADQPSFLQNLDVAGRGGGNPERVGDCIDVHHAVAEVDEDGQSDVGGEGFEEPERLFVVFAAIQVQQFARCPDVIIQ